MTLFGFCVSVRRARRPARRPVLCLTPEQVADAGGLAALSGYVVVGYPLGSRQGLPYQEVNR